MKRKSTIQGIKRETYRLLNSYLGLSLNEEVDSNDRRANLLVQTPDCVNSRVNGGLRKNLNPNNYP